VQGIAREPFFLFYHGRQQGVWRRFFANNKHRLKMLRFDFKEAFWMEVDYIITIIKTIPLRISR